MQSDNESVNTSESNIPPVQKVYDTVRPSTIAKLPPEYKLTNDNIEGLDADTSGIGNLSSDSPAQPPPKPSKHDFGLFLQKQEAHLARKAKFQQDKLKSQQEKEVEGLQSKPTINSYSKQITNGRKTDYGKLCETHRNDFHLQNLQPWATSEMVPFRFFIVNIIITKPKT